MFKTLDPGDINITPFKVGKTFTVTNHDSGSNVFTFRAIRPLKTPEVFAESKVLAWANFGSNLVNSPSVKVAIEAQRTSTLVVAVVLVEATKPVTFGFLRTGVVLLFAFLIW